MSESLAVEDAVLLANRFKFLNLVQTVAREDVRACVDAVGIEALHFKTLPLSRTPQKRTVSRCGQDGGVPVRALLHGNKPQAREGTARKERRSVPRRGDAQDSNADDHDHVATVSEGTATTEKQTSTLPPEVVAEVAMLLRQAKKERKQKAKTSALTPLPALERDMLLTASREQPQHQEEEGRVLHDATTSPLYSRSRDMRSEEVQVEAPTDPKIVESSQTDPAEGAITPLENPHTDGGATLSHTNGGTEMVRQSIDDDDVQDALRRIDNLLNEEVEGSSSKVQKEQQTQQSREEPGFPSRAPHTGIAVTCEATDVVEADISSEILQRDDDDIVLRNALDRVSRLLSEEDELTAKRSQKHHEYSRVPHSVPFRNDAARTCKVPPAALDNIMESRKAALLYHQSQERVWNTSNLSITKFCDRLTDALMDDLMNDAAKEIYSALDEYVDGMVTHELS